MKTKRPISIYILLAILGVVIAFNVFIFIKDMFRAVEVVENLPKSIWVFLLIRFTVGVALLSFCFWAIYKRKPSGRWIGVFLILLIFAGATYSQFYGSKSSQMLQTLEYESPTLGNQIELFIRTLIFGYWLYAIGFSRKARLYYHENYLIKLEKNKIEREERERI